MQNATSYRQDFILWGLVPLQSSGASQCPSGISRVETGMNFGNLFFTAITAGIYTAETVEVWCREESTTTMQMVSPAPRGFYVVPQ